jgi:hypothetical protein
MHPHPHTLLNKKFLAVPDTNVQVYKRLFEKLLEQPDLFCLCVLMICEINATL